MQSTKYTKSNQKENLKKYLDLQADERSECTGSDSRLIALVSREIVAAELHYQRTCY